MGVRFLRSTLLLLVVGGCADAGAPSGGIVVVRSAIEAGSHVSCGVGVAAGAYCWGENFLGRVGDGTREMRRVPTRVAGGRPFVQVSAMGAHACALTAEGEAYCWGQEFGGSLGRGALAHGSVHPTPERVLTSLRFRQIAVGGTHTCALTAEGTAYCWGANTMGQLGDGTTASRSQPAPVADGLTFAELTSGTVHTCGRTHGGEARCWGTDGGWSPAAVPVPFGETRTRPVVIDPALRFTSVVARGFHTLALTATGAAYAWGRNEEGQLGDGTTTFRAAPVPVAGGLSFSRVSGGYWHSCGLTTAGVAHCWGAGSSLGIGVNEDRLTPTAVLGAPRFRAISAGLQHTVATDSLGAAWAWGAGNDGSLGTGPASVVLAPALVLGGLLFR